MFEIIINDYNFGLIREMGLPNTSIGKLIDGIQVWHRYFVIVEDKEKSTSILLTYHPDIKFKQASKLRFKDVNYLIKCSTVQITDRYDFLERNLKIKKQEKIENMELLLLEVEV